MRILIDTHIFLWLAYEKERISRQVEACLGNPQHTVYLSVASLWEIAIKSSLGKLAITDNLFDAALESGYKLLPLEIRHIEAVRRLPFHHRDPFDRMLAAQAQTDELTLITQDPRMLPYGLKTIFNGG